ncbi:MAG TPA: ATP phosphoribosyltransferase regulatory subunit, partial [Myxococcota bacterium]|nr:ATP phosphoribosyltransferase regulatory subunit [Myxococcota bacterium]
MRFQALPGFRDFFPDDLAVRRWIESAWHRAARNAGFEEIDGPVLEALELLTAKSGPEIANQLYAFTDKGGREVALRPEMTPTLARMVAARGAGLPKPIKWYSTPEFYRYEKMQRGRLRAFFQWNVDVIGSDEPAADAEAIAVALDALRILGLSPDDVLVRINDR